MMLNIAEQNRLPSKHRKHICILANCSECLQRTTELIFILVFKGRFFFVMHLWNVLNYPFFFPPFSLFSPVFPSSFICARLSSLLPPLTSLFLLSSPGHFSLLSPLACIFLSVLSVLPDLQQSSNEGAVRIFKPRSRCMRPPALRL